MSELKIMYHDEVQIVDFGESRTLGPWIKLKLSNDGNDPLEIFRGLDIGGKNKSLHIANMTLSQGDIIPAKDEQPVKPYGQEATQLFKNGFFYVDDVLRKIGSDKQYREWIQKQPSAYSKEFSEFVDGEGRCEAAHVRRAIDSGTSYKPTYSCIPLTHDEHLLQHQQGETALNPREWFENQRNKYLLQWAKETLANSLGQDSMGWISPQELRTWCQENGVEKYLPSSYQNA